VPCHGFLVNDFRKRLGAIELFCDNLDIDREDQSFLLLFSMDIDRSLQ